jgi:hypothetical protein
MNLELKAFNVFYAGQMHWKTDNSDHLRHVLRDNPEIRDGCYVYSRDDQQCKWYLGDMTPMLIEDVPQYLRALMLIIG